jgi:hypothetical protein
MTLTSPGAIGLARLEGAVKMNRFMRGLAGAALCGMAGTVGGASAATETVLYSFTGGDDGGAPSGPLIFDDTTTWDTTLLNVVSL